MATYRQPSRVDPGIWVAVVLVVLASLAGAILLWWPGPQPAVAPPRSAADPDARLHRNAEAGYEIRSPSDWRVTESGTVTRLASPDRTVVVTVGVGPRGSLGQASDRLVASLRASYADVRLSGTEPEPIFGNRSLVAGGTAINDRGDGVRFLAIAIAAPEENYAMTVFIPEAADPFGLLPDLRRIVHSFRPPTRTARVERVERTFGRPGALGS